MAAVGCSKRTILRIRSDLRLFGNIKAPPNKGGQSRNITPIMQEALFDGPTLNPAGGPIQLWKISIVERKEMVGDDAK
ncbi:hypothetical protein EYZ11_013155 [Aspergillus tanneri]|uniref:Uncharacterized protein n=1 Tax=Aspergillus tanneri TaxID=1220188 RepID=A0A4S3IYD5_9EURO|nr:hypothetical protein EYZ11_013155 [Aspergillus tanneri]